MTEVSEEMNNKANDVDETCVKSQDETCVKSLEEIAIDNLNILLKLQEDDIITGNRYALTTLDGYEDVNNLSELESCIYFTFFQNFLRKGSSLQEKRSLYFKLDTAIDNIYENSHFQKLMDDDQFSMTMDEIDRVIDLICERNYIRSPLYYFANVFETMSYYCRLSYTEYMSFFSNMNNYYEKYRKYCIYKYSLDPDSDDADSSDSSDSSDDSDDYDDSDDKKTK